MEQLRQSVLIYKRSREVWILASKAEFIEIGDKFREKQREDMVASARIASQKFNRLRHNKQLPVFFAREKYDRLILNYLSAYVLNKHKDIEDAAIDLLDAIVENLHELDLELEGEYNG